MVITRIKTDRLSHVHNVQRHGKGLSCFIAGQRYILCFITNEAPAIIISTKSSPTTVKAFVAHSAHEVALC